MDRTPFKALRLAAPFLMLALGACQSGNGGAMQASVVQTHRVLDTRA